MAQIVYDDYGKPHNVDDYGSLTHRPRTHDDALLDKLDLLLDCLTDRQRFVIERSWGVGLERGHSFPEIAEAMGVDWTTVREHYHAGMKRLYRAAENTPQN